MECTYENYLKLNINGNLISLENIENLYPYWCYPVNSKPIGLEGRSYTVLLKVMMKWYLHVIQNHVLILMYIH